MRRMKTAVMAAIIAGGSSIAAASGVIGSKHDLTSGTGATQEVCILCHTPHNAADNLLLSNRKMESFNGFTVYSSATMDTKPTAIPSPRSVLCLTCHHDNAMVDLRPSGHYMHNMPRDYKTRSTFCVKCHPNAFSFDFSQLRDALKIGPDLARSHPISMPYPTSAEDPYFNAPPDPKNGWGDIKLAEGKVECMSCHDPHKPDIVPFLRKTNSGSALCLACHLK